MEGWLSMQQSSVKHNPATFYLRVLIYTCIALILYAAALSPLAALVLFPQGSPWRWLAVLCPAAFVFLLLPLRFSFAEALVQKPRTRYFSFDSALSMKGYGEKLLESLLHAANIVKWALPLLAMGGFAYFCKDGIDAKTLMVSLMQTGKTASNIVYGVSSFFTTLFGHIPDPQVAGGLMEGLYVYLGVAGLGVLVLLVGAVRNSATRYIWVLAEREERPVRTEVRRRLRGRRWTQMGVGLINLVLWAPFLVTVGLTVKDVLGDLSTQVMMLLASGGKGSGLDISQALMPLIGAFCLMYLPLVPARRIITAAFATRRIRHAVPKQPAAKPAAPEAQSEAMGYVPDWVKAANETPATPGVAPIAPSFDAAHEAPAPSAPVMAAPVMAAQDEPFAPAAEQAAEALPLEQPVYGPESQEATVQEQPSLQAEPPAQPAVDADGWAEETLPVDDTQQPGLGA